MLGLDIADLSTLDPSFLPSYTSPLILRAAYDTLVTMRPGQYRDVVPLLAQAWERTPDGDGWRFTLDGAATFATGNRVTAEDVRFSLDRARERAAGAGQFVTNIAAVSIAGPGLVDIKLRRPGEAILQTLAAPEYAVLEKAVVEDQRRAGDATEWLNGHSAGSGAYRIVSWNRRTAVQLEASPHPWRGRPGYRAISIRHMPLPAAQLRALERGEIDVAFNLIPEQIAALSGNREVRVEAVRSLDFVYLALTADTTRSPALAKRAAREAIGWAIDYEDLLGRLLGGSAIRPASFLPIGVPGSTEAVAAQLGFHQDLDRARALLAEAGLPDGFEVELAYGDDAIAGLTFAALARKLQTDLGRVGIRLRLRMLTPATLRSEFLAGKLAAALAFWSAPVLENRVWAEGLVERVGRRLGWPPPPPIPPLIDDAAAAAPGEAADAMWGDFQTRMVSEATAIVLFQPSYQVAIRRGVGRFPLTGAGWLADLSEAAPA